MPGEQSIQALQQRCSNLERDLDNALKMLREKDEVLEWASEHVELCQPKGEWDCCYNGYYFSAPTLYEALLVAYKEAKNIDESPKPT